MNTTSRSRVVSLSLAVLATLFVARGSVALTPDTATETLSPLRPRYELSAALDGAVISGEMRLRLENASAHTLTALVFHLYPEAFRRGSIFHAEARHPSIFEDPRETFPPSGGEGGLDLESIEVNGIEPRTRQDGTTLEVTLPEAFAPGASLEVRCRFRTTLPDFNWRSGQVDGIAFAGQWYPQLAAFDPFAGQFERNEYHRFGEFQSDTGDYSVQLHTRPGIVVGATGQRELVSSAAANTHVDLAPGPHDSTRAMNPAGFSTVRYSASGVRDFAWVAGAFPQDVAARTPDGIEVRALGQGTRKDAERMLEIAFAALDDFGKRYGRYPYPTLTVASTPIDGGMEYPCIVFIGQSVLQEGGPTEIEVITHEIAHQWWAMWVGTDGLNDAWIDEGLATYTTASVLDERYHPRKLGLRFPSPLNWFWPSLSFRERALLEAQIGDGLWPARPVYGADPPWPDPALFVTAAYSRAARVFFALEARVGRDRVTALLRDLVQRYGYQRLGTEAFLREARGIGAPAELTTWLEEAVDPIPESRPRGVRFFLLGPPPSQSSFAMGLLPLFGGRSRDDLVVGLRIAGNTPFRTGGPYSAFLSLPRFHIEADLLKRLDSGQGELILIARQATGRKGALEARIELGSDTRLYQLEASRLWGRSTFAGPFRLARFAVRLDEPGPFELLTARASFRWDATESLLYPLRRATAVAWMEGGAELESNEFVTRAGVQVGDFLSLGRAVVAWGGVAAAGSRDDPRRIEVEDDGWLSAWPGTTTTSLLAARVELLAHPHAPLEIGWTAGAGILGNNQEDRLQTGPTLRVFGELPFAIQLDLPILSAGGPDSGFEWRWALRVGPRVRE